MDSFSVEDQLREIPFGIADSLKLRENIKNSEICDYVVETIHTDHCEMGSTDVGDVSWLTPTAQIHVATWPNGCPGHSWQNVSCDRTEIGHKAAIHAGKVLAATAIDLFEDHSLLNEARAEFEKRTKSGFVCPIPADAVPVIPD